MNSTAIDNAAKHLGVGGEFRPHLHAFPSTIAFASILPFPTFLTYKFFYCWTWPNLEMVEVDIVRAYRRGGSHMGGFRSLIFFGRVH